MSSKQRDGMPPIIKCRPNIRPQTPPNRSQTPPNKHQTPPIKFQTAQIEPLGQPSDFIAESFVEEDSYEDKKTKKGHEVVDHSAASLKNLSIDSVEDSVFSDTCNWHLPSVMLAVLVVVVVVFAILMENDPKENPICSFDMIAQDYPKQDRTLWISLSIGITAIVNDLSRTPGVYLFVYDNDPNIQPLVEDIARTAAKCFGKNSKPVMMANNEFTSKETINDYGRAIERFKMKIKQGNVVLIANLNEIPAEAARAFHTICDTHSPIARNVVIFLTLQVRSDQTASTAQITEDTLIELWGSKLDRDELDPLITRVTDQVIALRS